MFLAIFALETNAQNNFSTKNRYTEQNNVNIGIMAGINHSTFTYNENHLKSLPNNLFLRSNIGLYIDIPINKYVSKVYSGPKHHARSQGTTENKIDSLRTSLVVQWLRICLATQRMWVQSLVGELGSHMPQSNRACVPLCAQKIPHDSTKNRHSQINK